MKKLIRQTPASSAPAETPHTETAPAKAETAPAPDQKAATAQSPAKGSLTDAKDKPAPTKSKAKKEKKARPEMTVLSDGLTYSLLSRVRNAFPATEQKEIEKGQEVLKMIDGRGQTQEISKGYVAIANKFGGAGFLSSVRTSAVRILLKKEREASTPTEQKEAAQA